MLGPDRDIIGIATAHLCGWAGRWARMLLSTAVVITEAPARYANQLLSHLGHKVQAEPLPDEPAPAGRLLFGYGVGTVLPASGSLVLRATAADPESLARVQDVLQRHLEKFGARTELAVTWGPVDTVDEPHGAPEQQCHSVR